MEVTIGRTFSLCTMTPWIPALEDELTFTRVDHRHGYVPEGEEKVTFTPKRLYHVPVDMPTSGTFPSGLLPRALDWLKAHGHTHVFEEFRDLARAKPAPDFTKVKKLRAGQGEALIQLAYADCGIIVAATAFGKSFVITQACRMYPTLRFIVVSPSVSVINTLYDNLCEEVGAEHVGRAGGGNNILGRRIMVSTTKSMKKVDPSEVDVMFFDEVHGVGDNDVAGMVSYFSECRRFGFTASPVRGDSTEMCMEALFGRFLVEVSYQEAVEMGNVVPIEVYMVNVEGTVHQSDNIVWNKRTSYWQNEERNKRIAQVARKVPPEQQCLIMVETLEHAVHLSKLLPDYTLVHFGTVREPYLVHEWRELTAAEIQRANGWIRTGEHSFRLATAEDTATPQFGWVGTGKLEKVFKVEALAAGKKVQMLGRLKDYKALQEAPTDKLQVGNYYLVKKEEFILDIPKSSLKLTAKEKDELRKRFESGELKTVIATTTWKEGKFYSPACRVNDGAITLLIAGNPHRGNQQRSLVFDMNNNMEYVNNSVQYRSA